MLVSFESLPDTSRIWIFPIQENVPTAKLVSIEHELLNFIEDWTSHNLSLKGSACIMENKFVIICVDESVHGASGCSIDKLMRFIQNLEISYQINLLLKQNVFVLKEGFIQSLSIMAIKEALKEKELQPADLYYDLMINNKGQLRRDWIKPIQNGWLGNRVLN